MELIAVILAFAVFALVSVTVAHYQSEVLRTHELSIDMSVATQEEIAFAHATTEYLQEASLTEGATVSAATLEAAGELPVSFPATNPFGQTPIAYIGSNGTALVTYTAQPPTQLLAALGISETSSQSMGGFTAQLIYQASQQQEAYASTLVAVEIQGGSALTPYDGQYVSLSTFFTGYPNLTEPMFAELVNLDAVYSGSENP